MNTQVIVGEIWSSSLGGSWRTSTGFAVEELRPNLKVFIDERGARLWAQRPRGEDIYYSSGRFAWTSDVVLHAGVPYGSGPSYANFNERGGLEGETEVRIGKDCYQLRNLRKLVGAELLTVAYGRLAPP